MCPVPRTQRKSTTNNMTNADKKKEVELLIARGIIDPACKGCAEFLADPNAFAPRHKASDHCRSGKHPHCSCDTCF